MHYAAENEDLNVKKIGKMNKFVQKDRRGREKVERMSNFTLIWISSRQTQEFLEESEGFMNQRRRAQRVEVEKESTDSHREKLTINHSELTEKKIHTSEQLKP